MMKLVVGKHEVGSDAEEDLIDLLDEINNTNYDDYLTIATYFHCRFENIHPFADGNGRVCSTLLNNYLMINGIKHLIIYDEDKKRYYECLREYDLQEDIIQMKKFLSYCQEKTWKKKNSNETKNLIHYLVNL